MEDKDYSEADRGWGLTGGGRETVWNLPGMCSLSGSVQQVYKVRVQNEGTKNRDKHINMSNKKMVK